MAEGENRMYLSDPVKAVWEQKFVLGEMNTSFSRLLTKIFAPTVLHFNVHGCRWHILVIFIKALKNECSRVMTTTLSETTLNLQLHFPGSFFGFAQFFRQDSYRTEDFCICRLPHTRFSSDHESGKTGMSHLHCILNNWLSSGFSGFNFSLQCTRRRGRR